MPFTAEQVQNAMNAALDFDIRGPALDQSIQEKPLLNALTAKQKTFPSGKEFITRPVKGVHVTRVEGYSYDDQVTYRNPSKIKRLRVAWKEVHAGIEFTYTEGKKDGISIKDGSGEKVKHSEREKTVLTGIIDDKAQDMKEGWAESFNEMLWRDGTQDTKAVPGVLSLVLDDPTAAGNTEGIDRTANTWWRNRANLAIVTTTPSDQNVTNALQSDIRQLRRYGGRPDLFLAGSAFMDALEDELKAKGNYTLSGWAASKGGSGMIDVSIADVSFKGVMIQYDPTLDDLGRSKYLYALDTRRLYLMVMEGEDRVIHHPERPFDRYVVYEGMTWTGALICDQLNAQGVWSIA
ncbi:MAG: phage major capsid protein [Bacteroidota bacterium]